MGTRAKLANMELTKIAWAAGFMDGEGYIGITRCLDRRTGRLYYRVQVDVGQVHREPIALFQELFGGTIGHRTNKKQGCWNWRKFGKEACEVIRILLPYLVVKRRQAELVLEYDTIAMTRDGYRRWKTVPAEIIERRRAIWAACVELNGGRALQADRLSEEALAMQGGATVGTASKEEDAEVAEMPTRLRSA